MKLGRRTLEGYLLVIVAVIGVIIYLSLQGLASGISGGSLYLGILLLILISVNVLNAILLLRLLDSSITTNKENEG